MSENLNKKPPKGILKQSSSFDTQNSTSVGNASKFYSPRCSVTSLGATGGVSVEEGGAEEDGDMSPGSRRKKSTKFDEMNILATLHPPDKDYGFMKIEEPKTPFNYYDDGEEICGGGSKKLLDPELLAEKMREAEEKLDKVSSEVGVVPDEDDEEEGAEGEPKSHPIFESKRKAHYNEYFAVKLARQLMERDEDEEEEEVAEKFIPREETVEDEGEEPGSQ